MLKYVLLICLISFSYTRAHSTEDANNVFQVVGDFDELILSQRAPMADYFEQQNKLRNADTNSNWELMAKLMQIEEPFGTRSWIIHALRARKSEKLATSCKSRSGEPLSYDPTSLSPGLRADLRVIWPNFEDAEREEILWKEQYNEYGSCVAENASAYFREAMELLSNRNVGLILQGGGIIPGSRYLLEEVMEPISKKFERQLCAICIPADNDWQQYLLEVQMCFNSERHVINCQCDSLDACDKDKEVIFYGPTVYYT